jgi:hypothetical protein
MRPIGEEPVREEALACDSRINRSGASLLRFTL